MQSLKQSCRPKHQVLILKCYPRLPKNSSAEEIKPNGSELSYLLYYASSRRSKLSKVGMFLERRTAADLHKSRTAQVQITLQILAAFLNSPGVGGAGPQGFGLFAPFVLRMLREVLRQAYELVLIESCQPVWDAFCTRQDHVALSADAEYRALFAEVVRLWAGYASKEQGGGGAKKSLVGRMNVSVGDAIRLRTAGLQALKSIADSDALGTEAGRQLNIVVPVVLENLYGEQGMLDVLMAREKETEEEEKEQKKRPSFNAKRTTMDGDPRAAEGTAAEADRLADEGAGVVALQCLKSIFAVENRGQVRLATLSVLKFMSERTPSRKPSENGNTAINDRDVWATKLFATVCTWTPVQDRFVVLFIAVENLIRSPIVEGGLDRQLMLSRTVAHVLGSDINLIGLSVMDILLGLLQHALLILQLGTTGVTLASQGDVTSSDEDIQKKSSNQGKQELVMEISRKPSPARLELLESLQHCISNLAAHVYYTDQISDMISAILLRLKPSPTAMQNSAVTASAIEDPQSAAAEVASNASLRERPNTDGFFSFDTAREVALNAVKNIIIVANSEASDSSYVAENRNAVPMSVWEGTQWLLRDSCADVRKTYVDGLCTWLRLELRRSDLRLEEDRTASERERKGEGNLARRATSAASARQRAARRSRSTFLQLLHLAIYENALQYSEHTNGDADMLLLHLLNATLARSLGLNAVRIGLPMMFRLQDDIPGLAHPSARVKLGSLVYGYLWALSEIFDFESTISGREIQIEIARRRDTKLWISGMRMPVVPIDQIGIAVSSEKRSVPTTFVDGSLKPFQHREDLIERVSAGYLATTTASPPPSAPTSPSRSFSLPALTVEPSLYRANSLDPSSRQAKLPQPIIDELSAAWSREELLRSLAAAAPKSVSLSGSRTGGHGNGNASPRIVTGASLLRDGNHRHLLAAANTFPIPRSRTRSPTINTSPRGSGSSLPRRGSGQNIAAAGTLPSQRSHRTAAFGRYAGETGGGRGASKSRSPASAGRRTSASNSVGAGPGPTGRVEELKRVLASGGATGAGGAAGGSLFSSGRGRYGDHDDDTGSESMMDVDESFATYGEDHDGEYDGYDDEQQQQHETPTRRSVQTHTGDNSTPEEHFGTPPETRAEYTLTGAPSDKAVIDKLFETSAREQDTAMGLEAGQDGRQAERLAVPALMLRQPSEDETNASGFGGQLTDPGVEMAAESAQEQQQNGGLLKAKSTSVNTFDGGNAGGMRYGSNNTVGSQKTDIRDLLSSIDIEDDDEEMEGGSLLAGRSVSGTGGIGRPPY